MKERFLNVSSEAESKQEECFNVWLSGQGIPFADDDAKAAYRERIGLIKDAVQLKKPPDRIPVCPSAGFFPIEYAGITMYEAMYDYEALKKAWIKYHEDFAPDAYNSPVNIVPGRPLDILDFKLYRWPRHPADRTREYQFEEREYMKPEEYPDLIDDPTAFFLNAYFPRIFGTLEPLTTFPLLPPVHELPVVPPALMPFGSKEMKAALEALGRAGDEVLRWRSFAGEMNAEIMGRGHPSFSGGFTKAPFDLIADSLRGTKGVMLDMFRYPDELKEACERLTPILVKCGVRSCRANGHVMTFIPLHKGADTFMSREQFAEFYWPTLRKLIIGLVNEGMVPLFLVEGAYNTRLDIISDTPKGKVVWWFDRTEMKNAKQILGQTACIAGNVPLDLLCTGTAAEVEAYCRELAAEAGEGGGFILSSGAGVQGSKFENVKAMIDSLKQPQ